MRPLSLLSAKSESRPLLDRIDVHIKVPRMDYEKLSADRLSISAAKDTQSAITVARWIGPDVPGASDGTLWDVERRWCLGSQPDCRACP